MVRTGKMIGEVGVAVLGISPLVGLDERIEFCPGRGVPGGRHVRHPHEGALETSCENPAGHAPQTVWSAEFSARSLPADNLRFAARRWTAARAVTSPGLLQ